ncbi:hypothetical protein ACFQU3_23810 [Terrabacter sp. GCM10028922]|uniref:hypothetical protein n=1 Tax=Terrabacter sp. GCM10028922 TaxID=3273428 RepID=UPI00361B41FA
MRRMAQAQGLFNVLGGVWPLVSMRTFEAVYGPKTDRWLVQTVGGLLTAVGTTQLMSRDPAQLRVARALGVGTATTLLAIDLVYVPKGRISRMYLQDAACEIALLAGWVWTSRPR